MRLDEIPVPDGAASRRVVEVATAYHSPALVNHCVRSHLFAAALGRQEGVAFDAELLHVAAMLHDVGLVPAFDSHTLGYEHAGGHVAAVFAAGAGWPPPRRRRVREVIVAHMQLTVDVLDDPEGYLLEASTALDISGNGAERWPRALRDEVVARYPRLDLAEEFVGCLRDQAGRKPATQAARVLDGLAERMARHPLG